MKKHKHTVVQINVAWKKDCVEIYCHCGKQEDIGLWYEQPPKGWAKRGWDQVIESATILHDNWYKQLERMQKTWNTWSKKLTR